MNVVCLTFGWMELAQAKSSAFSLVNFLGIFTFFYFFFQQVGVVVRCQPMPSATSAGGMHPSAITASSI